jgi:hypothetical protein
MGVDGFGVRALKQITYGRYTNLVRRVNLLGLRHSRPSTKRERAVGQAVDVGEAEGISRIIRYFFDTQEAVVITLQERVNFPLSSAPLAPSIHSINSPGCVSGSNVRGFVGGLGF